MPQKVKYYRRAKFSATTLKQGAERFLTLLSDPNPKTIDPATNLTVRTGDETWTLDSADEFFAEYRHEIDSAVLSLYRGDNWYFYSYNNTVCDVTVRMPERAMVEQIFEAFEDAYEAARLPEPQRPEPALPPIIIFIGHGRSQAWRELSDHLHHVQGYHVEAYETGPRAGFSVKEILERMLDKASFALIVHTAEDEQADGALRARQNVVHETGLFQGHLGFQRAIVLREEGCESFSNESGLNEIRFSKGNIKETYGEIVATIKREFPTSAK